MVFETISDKFGPDPHTPTRRRSLSTRPRPRGGSPRPTSPRRPLTPTALNPVHRPPEHVPRLRLVTASEARATPSARRNAVSSRVGKLEEDEPRRPVPTNDTDRPIPRPVRTLEVRVMTVTPHTSQTHNRRTCRTCLRNQNFAETAVTTRYRVLLTRKKMGRAL